MDRAWFAAVTAFPASLHGFTDLILHNCLLQLPQQGLCVVKEQAQVLSAKIVGRTAKATYRSGGSLRQVTMVAGVGFEPTTFRL